MTQNIKTLLLNIIVYGALNMLVKFINYVTVPFQTLILTPDLFGILSEIYTYIGIAQIFYSFGIETAYLRFAPKNTNFKNIAFSFVCFFTLILSASAFLLTPQISKLLQLDNCIVYAAISILIVDSLTIIPFAELRVLNKIKQYSAMRLIQVSMNVVLTSIIVLSSIHLKKNSIFLLLVANALANASIIPFAIYSAGGIKINVSMQLAKKIILYTVPVVFISLIGLLNDVIPKLGLKYFAPTNDNFSLGIYSAAQKISSLLAIGLQAYKFGVEPILLGKKNEHNLQWYNNAMHWFIAIMGCCIILVSLNVSFITRVFLRQKIYFASARLVPYLLFSNCLAGIYYNLSAWYKACDKNFWGCIIGLIGVAVNFIGSYVFIPLNNYFGSIIANYFAYIVMILFSFFIGKKFLPVTYSIRIFVQYIILTIGVSYLFRDYKNEIISFFASGVICLLVLFYTYYNHRRINKLNS